MRTRLPLLLFLLAVTSCATPTPEVVPPPVEVPETFSESGAAALPDRWWESFDDPTLHELVEEALAGNLDLRTWWDRLARFEAIARREGAARDVKLDGAAGAGVQRTGTPAGTTDRQDLSLGLVARYEVDLWGRLAAREKASLMDVAASEEEVRAAALSLSAVVATTWYQLVEQRARIDLLKDQIETNEKVLTLITVRFRQGRFAAADVLRQRQLSEATRGDLIDAESRERVLAHQLAVLLGRAPGTVEYAAAPGLPDLPPVPAAGLPAELVERRPDIREAYYRILAADRRVAEAVADRYPRIALTGRAVTDAALLADLFDNWLATLAAEVAVPILDGGSRDAEADRTRAILSESIHQYGSVILASLREVEDALVQERKQVALVASLSRQLALSEQVLLRLRDRYSKGALNYIDVLQALVSQQALQRNLITARRRRVELRVGLCRALAGGFELERPELTTLAEAQ